MFVKIKERVIGGNQRKNYFITTILSPVPPPTREKIFRLWSTCLLYWQSTLCLMISWKESRCYYLSQNVQANFENHDHISRLIVFNEIFAKVSPKDPESVGSGNSFCVLWHEVLRGREAENIVDSSQWYLQQVKETSNHSYSWWTTVGAKTRTGFYTQPL